MKRSLLALTLASTLLLSGCGEALEMMGFVTTTSITEPSNTTEPTTETTPSITESSPALTEPVTTEPDETTKPTEATKPTDAPKPTQSTKPSENTKPAVKPTKPTETTKPAVKPTETTKPTQVTKPTETTIPTETTLPEITAPTTQTEPVETEPDLSGWLEENGKHYYMNSDGSFHTGWLTQDGNRYYFYEDGTMAIGKVETSDSGVRYFTSTGKECILVNPWNYVPSDYSVKLSKYGDYKMASTCLDPLKQMLADCKSAGNKAVVVSAYRSHSYQAGLFERRIQRFIDQGYSREEATIEAAKRVAVPGTSEHELGLALDIVDVNYQNLDKKQEDTAAQKWLMANSWKYGFILRYPNEKSDVTGIIYEPWHYRYVGKELAKEIYESGLCLEEYFSSLT